MQTSAPSLIVPAPTWFDTVERRSLLLSVCRAWEGTPFFPNSEAPGADGGADCVHLLHGIFHACGVVPRLRIPRHTMDAGQHAEQSPLIEAFETWNELRARFARVWRRTSEPEADSLADVCAALLPGDALCYVAGRVPYHGGLVNRPGWIFHTLRGAGAHSMQLNSTVRGFRILGRLAAVYRPLP